MNKHLETLADAAGGLGILLVLCSGLLRLLGIRTVLGYEGLSIMIGGIALLAVSSVVQLYLLRRR